MAPSFTSGNTWPAPNQTHHGEHVTCTKPNQSRGTRDLHQTKPITWNTWPVSNQPITRNTWPASNQTHHGEHVSCTKPNPSRWTCVLHCTKPNPSRGTCVLRHSKPITGTRDLAIPNPSRGTRGLHQTKPITGNPWPASTNQSQWSPAAPYQTIQLCRSTRISQQIQKIFSFFFFLPLNIRKTQKRSEKTLRVATMSAKLS